MNKELLIIRNNMKLAKGVSIVNCPITFQLTKNGETLLIQI